MLSMRLYSPTSELCWWQAGALQKEGGEAQQERFNWETRSEFVVEVVFPGREIVLSLASSSEHLNPKLGVAIIIRLAIVGKV
jgi:hypothetical protein